MPDDPNNFDDDALDDEFPDIEDANELDLELEPPPKASPKPALSVSKEPTPKESTPIEQIDISHIPLKIQLEIARISVSLDELQKMKPGSKLPIDINPRIVNLVVGGKSIGQGEIVEIGDIVGVKILELYK